MKLSYPLCCTILHYTLSRPATGQLPLAAHARHYPRSRSKLPKPLETRYDEANCSPKPQPLLSRARPPCSFSCLTFARRQPTEALLSRSACCLHPSRCSGAAPQPNQLQALRITNLGGGAPTDLQAHHFHASLTRLAILASSAMTLAPLHYRTLEISPLHRNTTLESTSPRPLQAAPGAQSAAGSALARRNSPLTSNLGAALLRAAGAPQRRIQHSTAYLRRSS